MLRIIEGGFFSSAEDMLRKEISLMVDKKEKVLLIVPEQQTLIAEAEFANLLPPAAPLYFEATNFTRFSNSVFRELGGLAGVYSDKTKRSLVMWAALTREYEKLALTGGNCGTGEDLTKKKQVSAATVERAMAAVNEMKSRGITKDALRLVTEENTSDKRLLKKARDLAIIMDVYSDMLAKKYADTSDDLIKATERISADPSFISKYSVYVEGFSSFTEPQYRLLAEIARHTSLTVRLTLPKEAPDAFEYTQTRKTKDRLISLGGGRLYSQQHSKSLGDRVAKSEFLSEVCDLLWRTGKEKVTCEPKGEELRIFAARTPYEEADFIAADIRRRLDGGASLRDFAIIARDADAYLGILDSALTDAMIPHFFSRRRDAESFEGIKLIYTAFSAVCGGMRREDVISYAKCLPSGITRDACDEFDLYTDTWQISGAKFAQGDWTMSPGGYGAKMTEDAAATLASVNATRRAIIEPLIKLRDSQKGLTTVREHASALYEFLTLIDLEGSLNEKAKRLMAIGEDAAATENRALYKLISKSLDTLVEALGDTECDRESFIAELKVVFAAADIGRIPAYYDTVTVGSANMIRLVDKKQVYLIGVNRGRFPKSDDGLSYFSDRDRIRLTELNIDGLKFEPQAEDRNAEELFFFTRAFAYAKDGVTITYSERNSDGSASPRSDVISRIEEICTVTKTEYIDGKTVEKKIERVKTQSIKDSTAFDLMYSPRTALSSLGELDGEYYEGVREALSARDEYSGAVKIAEGRIENDRHTLSRATCDLIYNKGGEGSDITLSQTKIDTYNSCPLSYFLRYDLDIKEDVRAEFDARNIGTFIHAILEGFFKEVRDGKKEISSLSKADKENMVRRHAEEYLSTLEESASLKTNRDGLMIKRLCRATLPVVEGLCDEFSDSKFLPKFFELEIAPPDRIKNKREAQNKDCDGGAAESCEFKSKDGRSVYIHGYIDRVDTYTSPTGEVYVRVADYKTGTKVFSPKDIEEGKNLQLFLYLKSVVDSKNREFLNSFEVKEGDAPVPAGVIYVKTEIGDVRVDTPDEKESEKKILKEQKRLGMILSEAEAVNAMNSKYIPVRFKKSDDPYELLPYSADEKKLYTRDGWQTLSEKVGEVVTGIADDMISGKIYAKSSIDAAKKTPCEYCKFTAFCRNVKID